MTSSARLARFLPVLLLLGARPIQARYEGTLDLEAHFRRPGDTRPYHSEQRYAWNGKDRCRVDWTLWEEGDSTRSPESYLVAGDSVFYRPDPGSRWRLSTGPKARLDRLAAEAGIPGALLRDAGTRLAADTPSLDIRRGRLERLALLRAHPRLGDARDSVAYTFDGKEPVPARMLLVLHERDQQWRLRQRRVEWKEAAVPESLLRSPAAFEPGDAVETMTAEPKIVEIAPGVFAAEMEDIDSRSLIVEFADHLAVIEVALASRNGERLVDAAKRRWPSKPIRYALFSHYHPHYAGGLRAMIAEGATIVAPAGNEAFVRGVAALPFTKEPDRLAKNPRPLSLQTFSDRYELSDASNEIVAINYGSRSNHTDDFVVFWLPRSRVLFETELGWVMAGDKVRASRRAAPLLQWIDEQHLDVQRLVQSWPMRGNVPTMSRAELAALVNPPKQ
jgi:hypothetical protein